MLVAMLQYTSDCHDWRTGHSGNTMLAAGAFTISHTKCLKKRPFEGISGAFFVWNVTGTF
jgi:hypothetical protein